MDISTDVIVAVSAGVFTPVALYLGNRMAKRVDHIASKMDDIAREVLRHQVKWDELESDEKSWYKERDNVHHRIHSLEGRMLQQDSPTR
jgi:hypothetical protein